MAYIIYINNKEAVIIGDCEAAHEAYKHAMAMADIAGVTTDLVDGSTGEVLEFRNYDFSEDEEVGDDEPEEDFDTLEMGFDPYEGCYTYDC